MKDSMTATLDGKALGKASKGISDGFCERRRSTAAAGQPLRCLTARLVALLADIQMSLDRYVFADVDNFQLTV